MAGRVRWGEEWEGEGGREGLERGNRGRERQERYTMGSKGRGRQERGVSKEGNGCRLGDIDTGCESERKELE